MKKRLTNEEVCEEISITDELLSNLADITEGFVGAEIEQAVIAALFEAFSGDRALKVTDLERVNKKYSSTFSNAKRANYKD